jgi:hypothetical protein
MGRSGRRASQTPAATPAARASGISQAALPDRQRPPRGVVEAVPFGDHVVQAGADQPGGDRPHGDGDDCLGVASLGLRAPLRDARRRRRPLAMTSP